jgi:hypothetical protein
MKNIYKILLVTTYILLHSSIFSQTKVDQSECNALFDKIIPYSKNKIVPDNNLVFCQKIVNDLKSNKCSYYVKSKDGKEYIQFGLTWIYFQICVRSRSKKGINFFTKYVLEKNGSAEEELSFCFEKLFFHNPLTVMEEIYVLHPTDQKYLLDHLAWGFVNNRSYGKDDPYNDLPNKAMIRLNETRPVVLSSMNYEDIFFKVYPPLKKKTNYASLNKSLLDKIKEILIYIEDYKKTHKDK